MQELWRTGRHAQLGVQCRFRLLYTHFAVSAPNEAALDFGSKDRTACCVLSRSCVSEDVPCSSHDFFLFSFFFFLFFFNRINSACAASLARLIEFAINYGTSDILWIQGINAQATIVEMNVGIIVACGTCLPTFYHHTRAALSSASISLQSLFTSGRSRNTGTEGSLEASRNKTDYVKMGGKEGSQTELREVTPSIRDIETV